VNLDNVVKASHVELKLEHSIDTCLGFALTKCVVEGIISPGHLPGSYALISDFHTTLCIYFWWRNCLKVEYEYCLLFRCESELVFNPATDGFQEIVQNYACDTTKSELILLT
jgi:hypothetical protein